MISTELLSAYLSGASMREMAEVSGLNQFTLRRMFLREGLAIKKKDREYSYIQYNKRKAEPNNTETSEETKEQLTTPTIYKKLQIAEKALQVARDELNYRRAITRKEARSETLEQKVESIISKGITNITIPTCSIDIDNRPRATQDNGLIGIFSDIHIGEIVGDDVPHNEYNYEIARRRMHTFVSRLLSNPQQSSNIIICDLKDALKGVIHGGLYESEDSFIVAITKAVELYVEMYGILADEYDEVLVFSTGSNHDRVHQDVVTTDKHLDYGRLIDNMVAQTLKAAKVYNIKIITTDTGYQMFNVNGANIVAFHGDTLRTYKPTSTVSRSKLQDVCLQLYKLPYRHAICGHFHEFVVCGNQFQGLNIVNGSMVGNTSYGLQSGYADILASQTICFVESDGSIENVKAVQFN